MKPVLTTLCLSLFLHIVAQFVASDSQLIYTPVEDITIACGDSGTQINKFDNRTWSGDINSKFSPLEQNQADNNISQVRKAPSSSFRGRVPYTTARLSHSEFTYQFSLTTGQKFVRLYFYPASYDDFDRSKSLFSVDVGGYTLLQDFNASFTADAAGVETIYREFCLIIDDEQSLYITFTPSKAKDAYAFINGIEIVSMPDNLYYSAPQSNGVDYVGKGVSFPIQKGTAMEMVYRINIGGSSVSSNQDTGMYRNWDGADETYMDDSSRRLSVSTSNPSIHLKFAKIPQYSAPKEVYQTGRSMDINKINQSYNLTWEFPVDSNTLHLVRLHFCEFEPEITKSGERTFIIYMANQTADEAIDIIELSGGKGIPVYRDYVVASSDPGSQKKASVVITLQAFQMDWMIKYKNVMLNGLEIFKLVDLNGLLAQPNPNPKVTPHSLNHSTRFMLIITGVVFSILLFSVIGFLVFRQRRKVKDSGSSRRRMKSTMTPESSYLCRYFSLAEIKAATKNFNDTFIIGAGGFGNVYKGCIDGGTTPVAIKRLKPESSQGALEFKTEIELLSQLRHRHLVSLIGYCTDKGEMIIVYDYMARGTLRDHLYHTDYLPLPWEQRLQICIGTAQGLQYLHQAVINTAGMRQMNLTEWVKSRHHNGELDQIIDPSLMGKIAMESLNKFVEIAMSCVHDNGVERPSMDDVLKGLEFALQIHHSREKDINSIERKEQTQTSSSVTKDSITCISGTIFSEINNPSGR
ncbi:hypothetical protein M0R45_033229 [Rubus argutus]|uniref:Protein kinase domain-containing protein n=1 Tax=Rubus argutus TaxID=59490 RepID=A0AAW1WML9_RUBAR